MSLTETRTVTDESGREIERSQQQLYTLAELKALHDRPASEQDDTLDSGAYARALDWVREGQFEWQWWDTALDQVVEVFKACGIDAKAEDIEFDISYRSIFVLPTGTRVDEKAFLRALKIYLSGVDVRIPLLGYGDTPGNADTAIKAIGSQIRNLDLRSKDARIVKEQGLVVQRAGGAYGPSRSEEFDLDYHYEGLSDQFKEDANEFLSDLTHHGLKVLRDEEEYLGSEEALLEAAEANEYTFTRTGRRA